MGTKTVRLSEDVYEFVKTHKGPDETMSEAIERLVRRDAVPLTILADTLSEEEGKEAKAAIERSRRAGREKLDRLAEKRASSSGDDS